MELTGLSTHGDFQTHGTQLAEISKLTGLSKLNSRSFPKLTGAGTDFSPGVGPKVLKVPGAPSFIPLICYEAIFPGQIQVDQEKNRPGWLLNLTNDAWYGRSSGPYQHLAISRMRAIEEGIPLIRAANTGISGIYDAYGRATVQIDLDEIGVADGLLPPSTKSPTFYGRFGDQLYWLIVILLCVGIFILRVFFRK